MSDYTIEFKHAAEAEILDFNRSLFRKLAKRLAFNRVAVEEDVDLFIDEWRDVMEEEE